MRSRASRYGRISERINKKERRRRKEKGGWNKGINSENLKRGLVYTLRRRCGGSHSWGDQEINCPKSRGQIATSPKKHPIEKLMGPKTRRCRRKFLQVNKLLERRKEGNPCLSPVCDKSDFAAPGRCLCIVCEL